MTRERAKELAPIIAAWAEGRAIQFCPPGEEDWRDCKINPDFIEGWHYRIKPEPKKRPMTREEVLQIVSPVVLRVKGEDYDEWTAPWHETVRSRPTSMLEYAYVKEGKIGEPHAFEVEE